MAALTADEELMDALANLYADPLGHVMFSYPWDSYAPIQLVELDEEYADRFNAKYGPDRWACEFLDGLGQDIKDNKFDGRNSVAPLLYATASGHGIGKTVLVAFITKFIMDTRPMSKGTITANTADQLKSKTWAEVGKWHKLSMTSHLFTYNSGRGAMNLYHNEHKEEWRCDAQTCREENSEAFAGQHAASGTSFYIFDEASNVPDKIFEVREGGTTDGEPMVFDFGNPTRNSGSFFEECAGRFRHRYNVRCIDSRDVSITNKERIKQWEDDYGEDSDFFKVRVRGMFPSAGNLQFIPTAMVQAAQERIPTKDPADPLIIGVDVARFGDNESVIYPRLGYDAKSWPALRYRGLDTVQLTGKVIECIRGFKALGMECSGLFVDGGGVGGGVVDQLRALQYNPIEVQFGGKATNTDTYRYKSDEMWGNLKDALPRLSIPAMNENNGPDLYKDLQQREYGYTLQGNKIHLETKKDLVERGLESPDLADALALTFAEEVVPISAGVLMGSAKTVKSDYDPFEEII